MLSGLASCPSDRLTFAVQPQNDIADPYDRSVDLQLHTFIIFDVLWKKVEYSADNDDRPLISWPAIGIIYLGV